MGIKIKNLQTGEFDKFNIPALKGEKGEPGEIEPSEKVDYIGKQHSKLRDTMNANVDYIIKTAIGEFNYLDYEGQHITATNSIEGHAKSAILKGQTLVNLAQPSLRAWTANLNSDTASLKATTEEFIIDWSKGVSFNAWIQARNDNSPVFGGMLKADTDYTFIIRILENNPTFEGVAVTGIVANLQMWGLRGYNAKSFQLQAGVTGTIVLKYNFNTLATATQNIENIFGIAVYGTASNGTKTIDGGKLRISKDIVVLEGDYTNNYQHIPYFEGMQSVKMPVLTTVSGFNLLNPNAEPIPYQGSDVLHPDYFKAKFGDSFSITTKDSSDLWCSLFCYDSDKNLIKPYYQNNTPLPRTITLNDDSLRDVAYVRFECVSWGLFENIMLNYGEQMPFTEYSGEYKSNILSTPEDIELCGVGDIKDTLNCNTGEYIKRINSIILEENGKITLYSGQIGENTLAFRFSNLNINPKWVGTGTKPNLLCTTFPTTTYNESLASNFEDKEGICLDTSNGESTNAIVIRVLKSRLISEDVAGIRDFISKTKIDIVSEAESPVVKTVDLSDNHVYS